MHPFQEQNEISFPFKVLFALIYSNLKITNIWCLSLKFFSIFVNDHFTLNFPLIVIKTFSFMKPIPYHTYLFLFPIELLFYIIFSKKCWIELNGKRSLDRISLDRNCHFSLDRNCHFSLDQNFHNQLTEFFDTFHLIEWPNLV